MLIELTSQFPSGADGGVGSLSASGGQTVPDALSCPNCLTDCDEANYCSGCGRTLKYEERTPKTYPGTGVCSEGA